jgi:nicotinamidase-related amidase
VDKPGYGAFHQTDLAQLLAVRDIGRLYLCGVTTEVCVHSTLREAIDRGFECVVVADACGSAYPELHDAAMRMVAVEGGIFGRVMDARYCIAEFDNLLSEGMQ